MTYIKIPQLTQDQINNILRGLEEDGQGCLVWQRYCGPNGYGRVTINGESLLLHRVLYYIYYGQDPEDNLVLHSCDNRKCGRKSHLHLGTHRDNTNEMWERKRHPGWTVFLAKNPGIIEQWKAEGKFQHLAQYQQNGENNAGSKLTERDVREIRQRSANGEYYRDIAKDYNVTHSNIDAIIKRKSWKHIE